MKGFKRFLSVSLSLTIALMTAACSRSREINTVAAAKTENQSFDMSQLQMTVQGGTIYLPKESSENSVPTALQLIQLCASGTAENSVKAFEAFGLNTIMQENYDKDKECAEHTCAYTLGEGMVIRGEQPVKAKLIEIRGTSDGEWYSNFDVSPSRTDKLDFSENFLYSAEDVLNGIKDKISEDDLIIICGHSRGAACANILGILISELYGKDNVYVYTYATPATIHRDGKIDGSKYENIFNYINPADLVPSLPLEKWGFVRAGTDILLQADNEALATTGESIDILESIAPDLESYYGYRHSLSESGEDEWGMTGYEVMQILSGSLMSAMDRKENSDSSGEFGDISTESDLYPLINTLKSWSDNDGEKLALVAMQHMPAYYASLIMSQLQLSGE